MAAPKDKEYFKQLAQDHPHLARFIFVDFPGRFKNPKQQTKCDGEDCKKILGADQVNVFVTPAPEYKPLVLCYQCLGRAYVKYNATGQYDIRDYLLPVKPKKS